MQVNRKEIKNPKDKTKLLSSDHKTTDKESDCLDLIFIASLCITFDLYSLLLKSVSTEQP